MDTKKLAAALAAGLVFGFSGCNLVAGEQDDPAETEQTDNDERNDDDSDNDDNDTSDNDDSDNHDSDSVDSEEPVEE